MAVAFFGHRDAPDILIPKIRAEAEALILAGEREFYVGHNGHFDTMALHVMKELIYDHPDVCCHVVLAYLRDGLTDWPDTIFPEGLELVPPRFAIQKRNRWIVQRCDVFIGYTIVEFGGAYTMLRLAKRQGKQVILLQRSSGLSGGSGHAAWRGKREI